MRASVFPALTVLAAALLCCVLLMPGQLAAAGDPRSCIEEINTAMEAADPDAFERRLDIEAVAGQVFSELEVMAKEDRYSRLMPPMLALLASQGAFSGSFTRGVLVGEVRSFVRWGVGSGSFAGRKVENYQSDSMLAPLFALVSTGRKEITRVGTPVMGKKGRWTVPFTMYDHESGGTYHVRAVCEPVHDGWRMTGIDSLRALIVQILNESQEQGAGQV